MPEALTTLGDHIRKRRIETNRMQQDVAALIGVSEDCVTNWENNRFQPQIQFYPKIISFLGYYPFVGETETIGGVLLMSRRLHGFSHKRMGELVGADGSSIRRWERNLTVPSDYILHKYYDLAPSYLLSLSK